MEERRHQPKDPHLDIPSEANRHKHANFYEDDPGDKDHDKKQVRERRKEWQEGLDEGRKNANENS